MNTTLPFEQLSSGNLFLSVFTLFDTAMVHWFVPILFITYQIILFVKTKNLTLSWVTGIFFCIMYASSYLVQALSTQIIIMILILELAGILYAVVFK